MKAIIFRFLCEHDYAWEYRGKTPSLFSAEYSRVYKGTCKICEKITYDIRK